MLLWLVVGGLVVTVGVVLVGRWQESRESRRADLGPAAVRGLRLVGPLPGDIDVTCPGVGADLAVVRMVEQVPLDAVTMCLTEGRGPASADTSRPASAYRLTRGDDEAGLRALTGFSSAFSLPDVSYPWYRDRDRIACPAILTFAYPIAITTGTQSFRLVTPTDPCGPLAPTGEAARAVAELAQPVG